LDISSPQFFVVTSGGPPARHGYPTTFLAKSSEENHKK
jgi:hypothetical protein